MQSRDHTYYQDLLEQHVSGVALLPEQRMEFFDHIEECDECRAMLEAEERLTARIKTIPRMVAPSDLRARIVRQAVNEHTERTTTPCNDPRYADIVTRPPAAQSSPTTSAAETDDPTAAMPYFAGIVRPRPSRVRRLWRTASPAMAMGFLAVAGLGALYTGQFQGLPGVAQVQRGLWAMAGTFNNSAENAHSISLAGNDHPTDLTGATVPLPAVVHHTPLPVPPSLRTVETAATAAPALPGTSEVEQIIRLSGAVTDSVNSTMASLARAAAASHGIPAPAEKSSPQVAALVLKATDSAVPRNASGFLRQSEIALALESLTRKYPDSRLTTEDQFTMSGNRYRVYTLELPEGSTHQIVERLSPYQAPAEDTVMTVLASQVDSSSTAPGGADNQHAVRFFTGQETRLRSALEQVAPAASTTAGTRREQLRVVVVE